LHQKLRIELALKSDVPKPPKLLILAGWHGSSAHEKAVRWSEIELWAKEYGMHKLLPILNDNEYEYVD
jgi:hypothetical protein